jgi:MoaD family protein
MRPGTCGRSNDLIISLKFYSVLRTVVGREELRLRLKGGARVREAVDQLNRRYGDDMRRRLARRDDWIIMLNDRNIRYLKDLETPLADGDRIDILAPLSGG